MRLLDAVPGQLACVPGLPVEEDYKNSINKGFRGPPFVKSAPADQH